MLIASWGERENQNITPSSDEINCLSLCNSGISRCCWWSFSESSFIMSFPEVRQQQQIHAPDDKRALFWIRVTESVLLWYRRTRMYLSPVDCSARGKKREAAHSLSTYTSNQGNKARGKSTHTHTHTHHHYGSCIHQSHSLCGMSSFFVLLFLSHTRHVLMPYTLTDWSCILCV